MRLRNFLLVFALFCGTVNTSCVSSGNGQGIESLEEMTDVEFGQWKTYIRLGTKIGANRLLEENLVSRKTLDVMASTLETIRDTQVDPGLPNFLSEAVKNALLKEGLTNDEAELLILIVEQELQSRGAFKWLNPTTGVVELSPRTKELLTAVVDALRTAGIDPVTADENTQGQALQIRYNGKLLSRD